MLTSKERAELRARANELDTTLMVGKEGVSETVLAEANTQLDARELIKGKVLDTAMLSAREVSDLICEATGAEGVQAVGAKFVLYRKSEKLAQQAVKKAAAAKKKSNPVRVGVQKRRAAKKQEQERRNGFFKQAAIDAAIARRKAQQSDED